MEKLRVTQTLPENYHQTHQLDLSENRELAMILNLVGIGLLFGVAWLLIRSLVFLRPAYLSSENILVITGMREFWRGILLLVFSIGLMIVLNEGIRWILFWMITGQRPQLSFRGFYTYASAPESYLPRRVYLLIRLTPLVVITLLGLAAVTIVPLNLVPGVLLLVSLNIAAALNDMVMAWWVMQKPRDILIKDYGDSAYVYHYEVKQEST